ncbi:TPA: hypothetical protein DD449_04475 [Candidatus Berkelbacteria bacterium]|uniref:DZANK-type domain-containing protein n=1 Tax=Berkelbacteria bacterium GW2011_GWE1_39_12 TaxID=1618337 RepID=A0A0G4B427_9BACT|nr:MAG: hypothetical protein UT28_C0001G0515 [Berkelbacteria bacterium GW2011_GWE1_39_12]HBO60911.1 hypothetical protein [Candidatus Berkelbacteria bacterium]
MATKCPKCGHEEGGNPSYCTDCGNKNGPLPTCLHCGALIWSTHSHCQGCGLDRKTALTDPEKLEQEKARILAEEQLRAEKRAKKKWWQFWRQDPDLLEGP